MIATASYFVFDWWGQGRIVVAVAVMLVGLIGLTYLVYQHHYPEAKLPSTGIWVWLPLVLTWCFLGFVIYGDRAGAVVPAAEPSPAQMSLTTLQVRKDSADRYLFVTATVDGSVTADKYGKDNSIFIFCLTGDNKIDPGSDSAIDRSKPFDLAQRTVTIEVPLGTENTKRILKSGAIDIYLVMIPKSVDESNLPTFKDIYSHGGRLLDHKAMGETPSQLAEDLNGN